MEKYKINMVLEVKTGLHIGSGVDDFKIGGVDNPLIKLKTTNDDEEIYIPGSSLKGKLRSLLEIKNDIKKICDCGKCEVCRLFGSSSKESTNPSRVIVRDSYLKEIQKDTEIIEIKSENSIDRNLGKGGNPRNTERIIPGVKFNLEFIITSDDNNNYENLKNSLFQSIELLNNDYLGGNGSRGYGRVYINLEKYSQENKDGYKEEKIFPK